MRTHVKVKKEMKFEYQQQIFRCEEPGVVKYPGTKDSAFL